VTEQELAEWRYTIATLAGARFIEIKPYFKHANGEIKGRWLITTETDPYEYRSREAAVYVYLRRHELPTEPLP